MEKECFAFRIATHNKDDKILNFLLSLPSSLWSIAHLNHILTLIKEAQWHEAFGLVLEAECITNSFMGLLLQQRIDLIEEILKNFFDEKDHFVPNLIKSPYSHAMIYHFLKNPRDFQESEGIKCA
jgi:hypothetical protein